MKKTYLLSFIFIVFNIGSTSTIRSQCVYSGIGTNNPASKLHIVGCGNTSSTSSFQVANSSAVPLFFIRDDGNSGVNTFSPQDIFQVNDGASKVVFGTANSVDLGYGTSYIGFNAARQRSANTWATGTDLWNNGANIIYGDVFGSLRFVTIPTVPGTPGSTGAQTALPDATIAANTRLFIKNNGNIGIATQNPGSLLSIANGVDDPSNYGKALQITNLNGRSQQIAFIRSGNNVISAGYFGATTIWGYGGGQTNDAFFAPNYLSIDAGPGSTNGFVGIGNSAPAALLHVNRGNYAAIYLGDNAITGHHITHEPSDNSLVFWSGIIGSGTARIKLAANGYVGIGTTAPSQQLEVNGKITANSEVMCTGLGTNTNGGQFRAIWGNYGFMLRNDGNNTYFLLTNSADAYGSWNGLRPFIINNATGDITMGAYPNSIYVKHSTGSLGLGAASPAVNALLAIKDGHIQSQQSTSPTVSAIPTGSQFGITSATVAAGSTDTKGTINAVGDNNAGGNTVITINFIKTYTVAPVVVITPSNPTGQGYTFYATGGMSSFTLNLKDAGTNVNPSFNYIVIE